jgi:hypothetical protein
MIRMIQVAVVCMAMLVATAAQVQAAVIGLGSGYWYTNTLQNNLVSQGYTVNLVDSYDSALLSAYDVYIQDGNSYFDAAALDNFVCNGGTLIQIPWSQTHNTLTSNTVVIGSRTDITFGQLNPAITVLDSGSWLLDGVTLPGAGAYTIGREIGNLFVAGTQVLEWADGTALLGYREYGEGLVVSFNLHLITSDSHPLNAPWSNQIVYNAVEGRAPVVPEPASLAAWGGFVVVGLIGAARRRRQKQSAAI